MIYYSLYDYAAVILNAQYKAKNNCQNLLIRIKTIHFATNTIPNSNQVETFNPVKTVFDLGQVDKRIS